MLFCSRVSVNTFILYAIFSLFALIFIVLAFVSSASSSSFCVVWAKRCSWFNFVLNSRLNSPYHIIYGMFIAISHLPRTTKLHILAMHACSYPHCAAFKTMHISATPFARAGARASSFSLSRPFCKRFLWKISAYCAVGVT